MTIYWLLATSMAAVVIAAPTSGQEYCWPNYFAESRTAEDITDAGVAKVYRKGNFSEHGYVGTAFVIDADLKLLLTARHVADAAIEPAKLTGENVSVVFPKLDEGGTFVAVAKVLAHHSGQLKDGVYEDSARDLALLQITDELGPLHLKSLPLSTIDHVEPEATAYSFFGASQWPTPARAPTVGVPDPKNTLISARCAYRLDHVTNGGDSGSPVLNDQGVVIGIVLRDAPIQPKSEVAQPAIKFGNFLPTRCIADVLSGWYMEHFPKRIEDVRQDIMALSAEDLAKYFKRSTGEPRATNIEYYSAVESLADDLPASLMLDKAQRQSMLNKYFCPIKTAVDGRRIRLSPDTPGRIVAALYGAATIPEAADHALLDARKAQTAGNIELAAAIAQEASRLYRDDLVAQGVSWPGDDPAAATAEWQGLNADSGLAAARTYKGFADALFIQARALASWGEDVTQIVRTASAAALSAATLANAKSSNLTASSLATYADTAVLLDDLDSALSGYSLALNEESSLPQPFKDLIGKNFDYASGLRDNYRVPKNSPDYRSAKEFYANNPQSVDTFAIDRLDELGGSGVILDIGSDPSQWING